MNKRKEHKLVELSPAELESISGGSGTGQPWIVVGTTPIVVGTGPILKPAINQPQPW